MQVRAGHPTGGTNGTESLAFFQFVARFDVDRAQVACHGQQAAEQRNPADKRAPAEEGQPRQQGAQRMLARLRRRR